MRPLRPGRMLLQSDAQTESTDMATDGMNISHQCALGISTLLRHPIHIPVAGGAHTRSIALFEFPLKLSCQDLAQQAVEQLAE